MALHSLSLLDKYAIKPFPPDWPEDRRLFYSPDDNLHDALLDVINSAEQSLVIAMFGFADPALADAVHAKLVDPKIFVQLTLDASQAQGKHETAILTAEHYPLASIAIGNSSKGAYMHLKSAVIDGLDVIHGSTNVTGWKPGSYATNWTRFTIACLTKLLPKRKAEAHGPP